jgi:hypothetical protein
MFVKWSRTQSTGRLAASLSEGRMVNGTMKQEHIGMLATLRPTNPRRPTAAERAAFWEQAQASLDRLEDRLPPGQRAVLVKKLHRRVPMPDSRDSVI